MRSTLCLSSVLLLWPLSILALPLPPCPNFDPSPEGGVGPCEPRVPIVPVRGWSLSEGSPRRKARSAENMANADAILGLKPREDILQSEGPVRRGVESALPVVGNEGPIADPRAVRTLKERWIVPGHGPIMPLNPPGGYDDDSSDPSLKRRWTIAPDQFWDPPIDDKFSTDVGPVSASDK